VWVPASLVVVLTLFKSTAFTGSIMFGSVIPPTPAPLPTALGSCVQTLGGLAIGVSFGYMSFSMFVTALLLMPIAAATFRVNEGEGHFRWLHARLKEFAECGTATYLAAIEQHPVCGYLHPFPRWFLFSLVCACGCSCSAVVLYDGQRAEHTVTDTYFGILYWRMRRLFKVSSVALFFSLFQVGRGM
jgi:hypothetical protein